MKDETWGWREEKGRVESEDEKEGDEGGKEGGGGGGEDKGEECLHRYRCEYQLLVVE